jgi:iron complex transport system ATP-binding protein
MSLRASNLTVSYARGGPAAGGPALEHVSLRLDTGQCVAVVGPNGAGKSTLVGALSGQLPLDAGAVEVDGTPVAALGSFALARRIAVVEQNPILPAGFKVADVVAMGRVPHQGLFGAASTADRAAIAEALAQTGTVGLSSRTVDTLSGGESQRVVLARTLAQAADHLLLDEPTNHLDLRHQIEVLAFARRAAAAGAAVMLVLHDLNLAARVGDRVVMLAHGQVVADGPPAEVLTAATISEVYGAPVRVLYDDGVPVVVPRLGSGAWARPGAGESASPQ